MLVENVKSQTMSVGGLILIPGINQIADKTWDELTKSGKWAKPIKGLIEDETLKVQDARQKLTIAMVNKTYDVNVLNEWAATAKGPILGAIRKQLDALDLEKDL